MSQLKKNMKNDPNWSNYRKQQEEMKDVTPKKSFKDFFKKNKIVCKLQTILFNNLLNQKIKLIYLILILIFYTLPQQHLTFF